MAKLFSAHRIAFSMLLLAVLAGCRGNSTQDVPPAASGKNTNGTTPADQEGSSAPPVETDQPSAERESADKSGSDPYTEYKGQSVIATAEKDEFGNPKGSKFDLAKDGAFDGMQIAVLHLYTGEGFDFHLPEAALAEKGFVVHRWTDQPPTAQELKAVLMKSCQLWIISDQTRKLNADHLEAIRFFFDSGRGVYIWGDNSPFYADANYVAGALFGGDLSGNIPGNRVVHADATGQSGLVANHLICTGLENLYEGVTIATVGKNPQLQPIVFGSAGNLVVAAYDRDGKRALLDGGFTRLYLKWDTAGTGRYVKNAAAWLVNYEGGGQVCLCSKCRWIARSHGNKRQPATASRTRSR